MSIHQLKEKFENECKKFIQQKCEFVFSSHRIVNYFNYEIYPVEYMGKCIFTDIIHEEKDNLFVIIIVAHITHIDTVCKHNEENYQNHSITIFQTGAKIHFLYAFHKDDKNMLKYFCGQITLENFLSMYQKSLNYCQFGTVLAIKTFERDIKNIAKKLEDKNYSCIFSLRKK